MARILNYFIDLSKNLKILILVLTVETAKSFVRKHYLCADWFVLLNIQILRNNICLSCLLGQEKPERFFKMRSFWLFPR